MASSTWLVAVCCSIASARSRVSRATRPRARCGPTVTSAAGSFQITSADSAPPSRAYMARELGIGVGGFARRRRGGRPASARRRPRSPRRCSCPSTCQRRRSSTKRRAQLVHAVEHGRAAVAGDRRALGHRPPRDGRHVDRVRALERRTPERSPRVSSSAPSDSVAEEVGVADAVSDHAEFGVRLP